MASGSLDTFFSFRGRLSRAAFWGASLLVLAVFVVLFVFLESAAGRTATWILYPPFLWSVLALSVKRLHDRAKSPWWLLIVAIPVLGPLWLFVSLYLRSGTPGENQYGHDPRLENVDYLTVK
jgi:uncharacterized membrane protein YhaH (DUF805 family)